MFPSSFTYHRPATVSDAVKMLAENPDAKVLAGGHSLIPAMKLRLAAPGAIVDIGRIAELRSVSTHSGALTIGALATYDNLRYADGVADAFPIFEEAIRVIGDQQVRAHGTVGGSLAHADPAADLTAVMLALNANVHVTGTGGDRIVPIDDLFVDLWTTTLAADELITSITVPQPSANSRMGYEKMAHPASGYAVVGVAFSVALEDDVVRSARVAITGATSRATRATAAEAALQGKSLGPESIDAAAAVATDGLEINGDHFASEAYRSHLIKVLTARGLTRISGS